MNGLILATTGARIQNIALIVGAQGQEKYLFDCCDNNISIRHIAEEKNSGTLAKKCKGNKPNIGTLIRVHDF